MKKAAPDSAHVKLVRELEDLKARIALNDDLQKEVKEVIVEAQRIFNKKMEEFNGLRVARENDRRVLDVKLDICRNELAKLMYPTLTLQTGYLRTDGCIAKL